MYTLARHSHAGKISVTHRLELIVSNSPQWANSWGVIGLKSNSKAFDQFINLSLTEILLLGRAQEARKERFIRHENDVPICLTVRRASL